MIDIPRTNGGMPARFDRQQTHRFDHRVQQQRAKIRLRAQQEFSRRCLVARSWPRLAIRVATGRRARRRASVSRRHNHAQVLFSIQNGFRQRERHEPRKLCRKERNRVFLHLECDAAPTPKAKNARSHRSRIANSSSQLLGAASLERHAFAWRVRRIFLRRRTLVSKYPRK